MTICTPDGKGFAVAIMRDIEESKIHIWELGEAPSAKAEDE